MSSYIVKKSITQNFIDVAKQYTLNTSLNRSITNGERNLMATVAEIYYIHMISGLGITEDISYDRSMDYDVLISNTKVDVKTKQRTVSPNPSYMASIVAYSKTKQLCDYYAFCQITVDREGALKDFYYLGEISKKNYFEKSEFKKKDDFDGDNIVNGKRFRIREDCYNLSYDKLINLPDNNIDLLIKNGYEIIRWKN